MKQKIKVKILTEGCEPRNDFSGEWLDLRAAEDINMPAPYVKGNKVVIPTKYIPLGVAMRLPKGMEGNAVLRSSSNKNFHILQSNAYGVIDWTYQGNKDQWHLPVISTGEVHIKKGDRVCQFRITPSQKATFWQKLRWFLSNGIVLKYVTDLNSKNRGGLGHSGIK